jgi:hypothetical protein
VERLPREVSPTAGMDEASLQPDLRRAIPHSREAAAWMPNDPQRPRGRGYRNFLIVVVLVIATWALLIGGAVLLLELR